MEFTRMVDFMGLERPVEFSVVGWSLELGLWPVMGLGSRLGLGLGSRLSVVGLGTVMGTLVGLWTVASALPRRLSSRGESPCRRASGLGRQYPSRRQL